MARRATEAGVSPVLDRLHSAQGQTQLAGVP